jgi:transposase
VVEAVRNSLNGSPGLAVVERCFNRCKQFRAVATRYDKRAVNYRAMVVIASLLIWLEDDHRARHTT